MVVLKYFALLCMVSNLFAQSKNFDRVLIVVLENTDYEVAMQDSYLQSLIPKGLLLTNFSGVSHPSYPNYIAMVAGDTLGITDSTQKTFSQQSLANLLEAKKLSWKVYAEGYPGQCFLKESEGKYVRRHVPMLSFAYVKNNPALCAKIVSGKEFAKDWKEKKLPITQCIFQTSTTMVMIRG